MKAIPIFDEIATNQINDKLTFNLIMINHAIFSFFQYRGDELD